MHAIKKKTLLLCIIIVLIIAQYRELIHDTTKQLTISTVTRLIMSQSIYMSLLRFNFKLEFLNVVECAHMRFEIPALKRLDQ